MAQVNAVGYTDVELKFSSGSCGKANGGISSAPLKKIFPRDTVPADNYRDAIRRD